MVVTGLAKKFENSEQLSGQSNICLHIYTDLKYILIHEGWASLVVQMVKHLPAMWETWVRSLGLEDGLEKELATLSSILDWKTP